MLVAVGERWAATGEGVEVEHLLAETAASALRAVSAAPEPRNGRPVLLACAPEEQHSLPLSALAAALAEQGIGARLLGGGLPAARRCGRRYAGPGRRRYGLGAAAALRRRPGAGRRCRCCARRWPCWPAASAGPAPLPARVTYVPDLAGRGRAWSPARSAADRTGAGPRPRCRRSRPRWTRRPGRPARRRACRLLAGVDPDDRPLPERVRWLAGVCLGRARPLPEAARWLAPGGEPAGSLAASCLASHLRQVGRHAEAEPLDRLALAPRPTAESRADALIGLVADAVGRHELALARDRLGPATEHSSR